MRPAEKSGNEQQLIDELYGREGVYDELTGLLEEHSVIISGVKQIRLQNGTTDNPIAVTAYQKAGNATGITLTRAKHLGSIEQAGRYDYRVWLPSPGPLSVDHQYLLGSGEQQALVHAYVSAGRRIEVVSPESVCRNYLSLLHLCVAGIRTSLDT